MSFGMEILVGFALLLVVGGIGAYIILVFNGLVQLRNNIRKSWANIDVLLKQRTDELPNLIASVKGYMRHERETLAALTEARTAIMKATTMSEKAAADCEITAALRTIFAVAENYPNLRANENFLQLQGRITGLENEIADRREFYNDSVNNYNIRIQSIPDMFVAKLLGCRPEQFFRVSEEDKQPVAVKVE